MRATARRSRRLRDSTSCTSICAVSRMPLIGEQQDQGVRPGRIALDRLDSALFDRRDLLADQAAPLQQAVQLGQRVGRQRLALNRAQGFQMLRRLLQARLEALDAPSASSPLIVLVTWVRSVTSPSRSRPGRLHPPGRPSGSPPSGSAPARRAASRAGRASASRCQVGRSWPNVIKIADRQFQIVSL